MKRTSILFSVLLSVLLILTLVAEDPIARCQRMETADLCFQGLIEKTYGRSGLAAAFDRIGAISARYPSFVSVCHGNAHELGRFVYEDFRRGKDVDFTPKASYCGYGFYHGFMEALLGDSGNVEKGQELCEYLGRKLKEESTDAAGACYHGIGHGAVDGTDVRAWGDPSAMIAPALRLCEEVTAGLPLSSRGPLYRCTTGAYNSLELLARDPKYGLKSIIERPFSFCATQKIEYRLGCYTNMIPGIMNREQNDFDAAVREILSIPKKDRRSGDREQLITDLMHEHVRYHFSEADLGVSSGITFCAGLSEDFYIPCIEGLSGGHLKYGAPTKEYEGMLALCASEKLSEEAKARCYAYGLSRLRILYSQEKTTKICHRVPSPYNQLYCDE